MSHIEFSDYPALYQASDLASRGIQLVYQRLQKAYLMSLIVGSATSVIVPITCSIDAARLVSGAVAGIIGIGLIIAWVIRSTQHQQGWFDARAVAESVKSITWRYMMAIAPFSEEISAARILTERMREITKSRPAIARHIARQVSPGVPEISNAMRKMRSLTVEQRVAEYLSGRIDGQIQWYTAKAKSHSVAAGRWFWVTVVLQSTALVFAVANTVFGRPVVNVLPVITTTLSAVIAWSQIQRHDDLIQPYSMAAQELRLIRTEIGTVMEERQLVRLVEEAEEAISREHTMWSARRDV